jgi:hypothetical protein
VPYDEELGGCLISSWDRAQGRSGMPTHDDDDDDDDETFDARSTTCVWLYSGGANLRGYGLTIDQCKLFTAYVCVPRIDRVVCRVLLETRNRGAGAVVTGTG